MKKSNMHKTAVDSTSKAPRESEILPAAILLKTLKNPNMIASKIEPISQACILLQIKFAHRRMLSSAFFPRWMITSSASLRLILLCSSLVSSPTKVIFSFCSDHPQMSLGMPPYCFSIFIGCHPQTCFGGAHVVVLSGSNT